MLRILSFFRNEDAEGAKVRETAQRTGDDGERTPSNMPRKARSHSRSRYFPASRELKS